MSQETKSVTTTLTALGQRLARKIPAEHVSGDGSIALTFTVEGKQIVRLHVGEYALFDQDDDGPPPADGFLDPRSDQYYNIGEVEEIARHADLEL